MNPKTAHRLVRAVFLLLPLLGSIALAAAKPVLHPLFHDRAVLQHGTELPVWGWAEPGTTLAVRFAGQQAAAVAGNDGRWQVKLKPLAVSAEPKPLVVVDGNGRELASAADVLVGDVWLCSGQSNMEMGIGACNVPDEIAAANFPQIRLLTVPKKVACEAVETIDTQWLVCSPETVASGGWNGFSAVGYFFGRELHRELGIPIGLIHSSWGGTIAEAWTSEEGLAPLGDFKDGLDLLRKIREPGEKNNPELAFDTWCLENDIGSKQHWESGALEGEWKPVALPVTWENSGLGNFDGVVWYRRELEIPESWAGRGLRVELGRVDDIDTTWFNGRKVGHTKRHDQTRSYEVPADAWKPGKNTLAVRVLDMRGNGGFTDDAGQMKVFPVGEPAMEAAPLAGEWQSRVSATLSEMASMPPMFDENNPNFPTVLYNGMIKPLLPFAIKGAIWYQGESNANRAWQYQKLLPAMIGDWRKSFGVGEFPFYIVQLAAFQETHPEPRDNNWAELREAQAMTADNVPNCGLAVTIDVGDANDIHPKNKLAVGHRLALAALAQTYGKEIVYSGPLFDWAKIEGSTMRLAFEHTGRGLVAEGELLRGFAIAGEDRKFHWAEARISDDKKTVTLSSPEVPVPVAARYAWDINPVCNLFNKDGLPAVPFRTDDWPMVTAPQPPPAGEK